MKKQKCKTSIISSKLIWVERKIWNRQFQNTCSFIAGTNISYAQLINHRQITRYSHLCL